MLQSQFIAYLQVEKRYSSHTITSYRNDLSQFHEFLAFHSVLDSTLVTPTEIRNYLVWLKEHKTAESSIGRKISALRSFYKFLIRREHIQTNPVLHIKAPKIPKRIPVFIEEKKLNSLLDAPGIFNDSFPSQRDKMIIELLFGTGMRLAELLTLNTQDIDFYDQSVKVMGKRNKERIIPVAKPLISLIKQFIELKTLHGLDNISERLIVTNKGLAVYPKFIYRVVNKYLEEIVTQDKKSPHVLRHSYATSLLNAGADLNAIKELLGHAGLAATQVYVHNSVERLKSIYKQAHPKA